MKKKINKILSCVVLFAAGYCLGMMLCVTSTAKACETLESANDFKREMICAYEQYYAAAERLLDLLDDKYDWVDCYDPEDYYVAVERLDSLYAQEL